MLRILSQCTYLRNLNQKKKKGGSHASAIFVKQTDLDNNILLFYFILLYCLDNRFKHVIDT
jgi:hypothetical protein